MTPEKKMFQNHADYLNFIQEEQERNVYFDSIVAITGATKILYATLDKQIILLFGERHNLTGHESKVVACENTLTASIEFRILFDNDGPKRVFDLTGDVAVSISSHRLVLGLTGQNNFKTNVFLEQNPYRLNSTKAVGISSLRKLHAIFEPCVKTERSNQNCFLNTNTHVHAIDFRTNDPVYSFIFQTLEIVSTSDLRVKFNLNDLGIQDSLLESKKFYELLFKQYGENWEIQYLTDVFESENFNVVVGPFVSFGTTNGRFTKLRNGKIVSIQKAQIMGLENDGKTIIAQNLVRIAKESIVESNIIQSLWRFAADPSNTNNRIDFLRSYTTILNNYRLLMDIPGIARSLRTFGLSNKPNLICGFFGQKHTENWARIYSLLFDLTFDEITSNDACLNFDLNNQSHIKIKEQLKALLKQ